MQVLFVIAPENFRDEEYKIPLNILQRENILVFTASTVVSPVRGMLGLCVKPDISIDNIKAESFDAILLVGGDGAKELWDNKTLHKLLKDFYKEKKLIGAICLAPVILAKAGLLRKKRATVYETASRILKEYESIYTAQIIELDDGIITANGPAAANIFGRTFAEKLLNA